MESVKVLQAIGDGSWRCIAYPDCEYRGIGCSLFAGMSYTQLPGRDAFDDFAFRVTDRLIEAGIIQKAERARAVQVVANHYEELFPEAAKAEAEQVNYGG